MNLNLTTKLAFVFFLFAASVLVGVNALGYKRGQSALEATAITELEAIAGEKEAALTAWVKEKQADLVALAAAPSTIEIVSALLRAHPDSAQADDAHTRLVAELKPRVRSGEFLALMMLDPQTGTIIAATTPEEAGKSKPDRSYFLEGKKAPYITEIYHSSDLQAPAMTASAPIFTEDGQLMAVLAGRLNLADLNTIIQRRTGMRETDDAYLVNTSHLIVTQPRFLPAPAVLEQGIHSGPVNLCLEQKSGTVFASDYQNMPVIAAYRWLPEPQMCLIVKISQAEALAPISDFRNDLTWLVLAALGVASIVALALSRTIIRPILSMQEAAQRYASGDLDVRLSEARQDELGMLAREFNRMAIALSDKEAEVRAHSLELEKRVAERTADLRQSEARYRSLFENMITGYAYCEVIFDHGQPQDVICREGNNALEVHTGLKDVVGRKVSDIIPGIHESNPELFEVCGRVALTGKPAQLETYLKPLDMWFSISVYSPRQNDFVVVFDNITERKQAEESLREKERLLSEAQRIGRIGSWSYDILNDGMRFSDEMYHLLDVQPEDFHHNREDFLALVYPSDRPMAARWFADIREATQTKDLDFRLLHKNGELCYLHCTGAVEFDSAAKPARFIGTAQDVTERRAAEIQIEQQIKRLTALSEIDRAIISTFDQRYTLSVILSHILSQLQMDAVDVLLLDPERNALTYAAGQGFRTKTIESAYVRIGEGHAGRAAKERRMIRIPDLRETTNPVEFDAVVMAEGFVSYVAVPLIVKGNVKGVLEVFQRSIFQPYQEWLEFFNALVGQTAIAIENTTLFANLQSSNQELVRAYDATIEGWSRAMDLRDRETEGHTQRVTKLTLDLARSMGIDESRLIHIRRGALLHDIGKLGVPDHILFKPEELTVEERAIIERHVDFAYEMLAPIPYLKPALNIPYFHHEKWDGTGYPLGLKGEKIPLEARIFALVDVWDALISDRPYRRAWTCEKALEYISAQSGTHFDPRVVECFLDMIRKSEG